MEVKIMNLRNDQRGFIFSLDAVLAVLVTLTVLAGVAQIGISSSTYEQHGYLRLERYAEDAIEVMHQTGALDNVIASVVKGNLSQASEIARDNLRTILPPEIQFKFLIGDEGNPYLDNVYPGTENQAWEGIFESVGERAVAIRVTGKRLIPLKVLVWVDTRLPSDQMEMIENFVEEIKLPSWDVRKENNEIRFRNYLLGGMDWAPHVVFIPDSRGFEDATINALIWHYNVRLGGVVGGGGFLYWNEDYNFPFFGVWVLCEDDAHCIDRAWGHENLHVTNHEHPITATSPDYVNYMGDQYPVHEYLFLNPITGEKATPLVENLAYWPGTGGYWWYWYWIEQDWVGLTARWSGVIGENKYNRTVLFNAHLAQSAMEGVGTDDWVDLARRAIEWASGASLKFNPIKLYVWRGEVVS
ncbi:MAG: hypothetical protein U9M97_03340 [Candidatus Hadarchaeota archaeon]|nr:hypothetical protein [Candidatus Hadarchaeota archaeon]